MYILSFVDNLSSQSSLPGSESTLLPKKNPNLWNTHTHSKKPTNTQSISFNFDPMCFVRFKNWKLTSGRGVRWLGRPIGFQGSGLKKKPPIINTYRMLIFSLGRVKTKPSEQILWSWHEWWLMSSSMTQEGQPGEEKKRNLSCNEGQNIWTTVAPLNWITASQNKMIYYHTWIDCCTRC